MVEPHPVQKKMAKIGIFPKKIGVNMRKYLRPSPRKKTPAPPCFFPVSAWDFGLKLTQLWKNPDNFLKVGKGWDWRWNYVEHIETLLVQSMVNCWFGYSWSPLYERDCAGVSLEPPKPPTQTNNSPLYLTGGCENKMAR